MENSRCTPLAPVGANSLVWPIAQPGWIGRFRKALGAWYRRHARDLPWRRTRDPYAILVSEMMLQQTQVATVRPYFERFVQALPDFAALAAADEEQVLRLWEGLGYYRRARQLHRAAGVIVRQYGGRFPRDVEAAQRLPGVGRYTAGAVLSIAFDLPVPILEGNTTRLFSRLLGYRQDPWSSEGQRILWAFAEAVLPARHAGRFNQALMELGSLVCTRRTPRCESCPAASLCAARREGLQSEIPRPRPRPATRSLCQAAVVVRHGRRVLLRRFGPQERWAGLWDFPRVELPAGGHGAACSPPSEILVAAVQRLTGVLIRPGRHLGTLRHQVTRFRITLECYEAFRVSGRLRRGTELRWVPVHELAKYPLSSPGRKLARLVSSAPGNPDLPAEVAAD